MTGFFRAPTRQKARRPRVCEACLAGIPAGETYVRQTGVYAGSGFDNRYHGECFEILNRDNPFEFTPGELNPPARLKKALGG